MKNKIFLIIVVSLIVSCNGLKKLTKAKEYKWFPSDYKASQTVLLIQEPLFKKYTKDVTTCVAKNYPYPFKYVSIDKINSNDSSIADTSTYKYALISIFTQEENTKPTSTNYHINGIDFYLIDRRKKIKYT